MVQESDIEVERDHGRRAALVAGLRELADFFAAHPDFPMPYCPDFTHCVLTDDDQAGMAELTVIAAGLGLPVDTTSNRNPGVDRQFGGVAYRAFYVSKESSRRHQAAATYGGCVEPDEVAS